MRIGIGLTETPGPGALADLAGQIGRAAADGFASAWIANIFGLDALTALAVAGSLAARERGADSPGIELGTAVVPTYPRHPAALAQQTLTAALAVGGQLTLGIGLSHELVIDGMYGYSFDRPARHMREYLSVLGPLLDGEAAAFSGETLRGNIALSVPRPARPPLLLAAMAPQMLRLAGERADGTILWMTGPDTVRDHIVPSVTAAAEQAGRPAPRVVCQLPVCVTDDPAKARAGADKIFAIYGQLPSYRAMLDREGAATPAGIAIVGDEDAVAAGIAAVAEAGATDFVAVDFSRGDDAPRTRALLKSLAAG